MKIGICCGRCFFIAISSIGSYIIIYVHRQGGTIMKLTGELKKQVEKTDNRDEKKRLIEEAGVELSEDELDKASGGYRRRIYNPGNELHVME